MIDKEICRIDKYLFLYFWTPYVIMAKKRSAIMKRLHLVFSATTLAVIIVGLIHGGVAWIVAKATWDPWANSFPTWVAFVLPLVYYSVGVFVILFAWLTTWLILRGIRRKKGLQKGNQSDIIQS